MADTADVQLLEHTVFAVAVAILTPEVNQQPERDRRLQIKRRCMAYAKHKGLNLQLIEMTQGKETWVLEEASPQGWMTLEKGSLQQCCRNLSVRCGILALDS